MYLIHLSPWYTFSIKIGMWILPTFNRTILLSDSPIIRQLIVTRVKQIMCSPFFYISFRTTLMCGARAGFLDSHSYFYWKCISRRYVHIHVQHLQGLINLFLVKGNVSFFQTDEKHGSSGTCTSFIYRLDIHFQ
jgi:hypothetical protein